MQIITITDKKQLNDFVSRETMSQFLQSFEWGEFQGKAAGKIIRLGVLENNELAAAATFVKKTLPMGKSYFLCPRGPIIGANQDKLKILKELFDALKKFAENEDVIFLRFEPVFKIDISPIEIQKTLDIQPSKTLILDLTKSEEELLKEMHQKTRYNIKLAAKKEVKMVEAGPERFDDFWRLMNLTGERDNFRPHGIDYYKKMLEADSDFIKLYFAEYKGKPLVTGIFSYFGDTVSYLHGASADHDREVMAPYLLHWQIIKEVKAAGFKYYDLCGINEKRWPGVTRFKKGFGGFEHDYPGTFDYIFDQNWYSIYKMVRQARRTF
ncbi:MAG: peptidoglycan bridge formation glycyltransferase FemA/FemB family protein [Patescibacteria group bacterium]|jgi:lipid II:glycine glycyltransferase (peptidoglycan interpeptide bridge formation enzyme)